MAAIIRENKMFWLKLEFGGHSTELLQFKTKCNQLITIISTSLRLVKRCEPNGLCPEGTSHPTRLGSIPHQTSH